MIVRPGQPISIVDVTDAPTVGDPPAMNGPSSVGAAMRDALAAYTEAARSLLHGKYQAFRGVAPVNLREPCSIFILKCTDGVLVRYDSSMTAGGPVRYGDTKQPLAHVAPMLSDQLLHFPDDPETYPLPPGGCELELIKTDASGAADQIMRLRPAIFASTKPRRTGRRTYRQRARRH